ncbi:MAG TPA: SH3 domain-containing protein [Longimicrobium sp.]|jgi:uncharacterized protein YraI
MQIDRTKFFAGYTAAFGALKQSQTDGLDALLAAAEGDPQITDLRWLAYMLATVKHECAGTWKPIEEYGKGKGRKYGQPVTVTDPAGKSFTNVYYGRGYVQLTWDYNYRNMGNVLKNRLLYEPELALDADVAYRIMSYGMRNGSFTGARLSRFINGATCDYVNARKIINGLDQAQRIAGYAQHFETILNDSVVAAVRGVPIPQPAAPPPAPQSATGLFTVTVSSLNVRSGPGASNPTVAGSPVPGGTVVEALEEQGGWKRVAVQGTVNGVSGVTGWVSAAFLQPAASAPAQPATGLFTVTASSLNVRGGPGTSNPIVAGSPLAAGTVVEGFEDQGGWKRIAVQGSGVTGWVSAKFLQPAVPAPA